MTVESASPDSDSRPLPGRAPAPVIRSAGITLAGSAIGGVLVVSSEFVAAHYMRVEAYGLYASGMTMARIGEALSVFALPVAIFHFVPMYLRHSQREQVVGAVLAAALLPLALGCSLAVALALAAPWLAANVFHHAQATTYIRLLAAAIPFMAMSEVLGAITRGYGYAKYYVLVRNLLPPLVFVSLLACAMGVGAPPIWITGAMVAAYVVACAAGITAVARVAGADLWRLRPDFRFGTLYRYAAAVMANSFLYMVFAVTGTLAVAYFLGSDRVGIFRVCLQFVVPFEMVVLAFHAAMGPIYPVLIQEKRHEALQEAYSLAVRWKVALLLPIGIVVAWNARDFLGLLGADFAAGAPALVILAIGYASCNCFATIAHVLMFSGRQSAETLNAACATVLNIAMAIWLVPSHGFVGAALATAGSYLVLNVMRVLQAHYHVGLRTFRPDFLRTAAVSAGAALASFWALQQLGICQGPGPAALAGRIALVGIFQCAAMWTVGLGGHDRELLVQLARTHLARRPRGA